MINKTLTYDNLKAIKKAMEEIELIDQSDHFKNYYKEIEWRLKALEKDLAFFN